MSRFPCRCELLINVVGGLLIGFLKSVLGSFWAIIFHGREILDSRYFFATDVSPFQNKLISVLCPQTKNAKISWPRSKTASLALFASTITCGLTRFIQLDLISTQRRWSMNSWQATQVRSTGQRRGLGTFCGRRSGAADGKP